MNTRPISGELGDDVESFIGSHLRRNFAMLSLDFGSFGVGMTLVSATTILPAFAEHLGASNLFIGAIPSIMYLGYGVPALFFANHTERLSRKLRFILTITVWERLPVLFLAISSLMLAERWPGLMLLLLLLSLLVMTGAGGAIMPAWLDLIGKLIPERYRGRLFGFGNIFSAVLGLGGAALAGYFLQFYRFPLNYALCFGTGFAFLALSYVFFCLVKEPAVPSTKPEVRLVDYLKRLPGVLERDRNFTWFLAHRAAGIFGAMANGFYAVFALRVLGAPEWQVARFTLIFLAGQIAASLLLGYLADRLGHKPVLVAAMASLIVGNAIALASTQTEHVYIVFLCMAIYFAGFNVSAQTISLEFAPVEDRPTYIGLNSTLLAPLTILSSLIGGILADQIGYGPVFAIAGLASALSVAILAARVHDPRLITRMAEARVSTEEG